MRVAFILFLILLVDVRLCVSFLLLLLFLLLLFSVCYVRVCCIVYHLSVIDFVYYFSCLKSPLPTVHRVEKELFSICQTVSCLSLFALFIDLRMDGVEYV